MSTILYPAGTSKYLASGSDRCSSVTVKIRVPYRGAAFTGMLR
jgi:hypothetical protein